LFIILFILLLIALIYYSRTECWHLMDWLSTWHGAEQINPSDARQFSIEMSKGPTK